MVRKKKICKGCKLSKFLFAKGFCDNCYKKTKNTAIKKNKPLKKQTKKQGTILRKYSKLRKEYLLKNPLCAIQLPDCTRKATEIHHSAKKYSEKLWLDTSFFVPCCHNCHTKIEESPNLAKEKNLYNYKTH